MSDSKLEDLFAFQLDAAANALFNKYIAELEADNNRLKCSNDTQTQTFVYGKEDSEVQE